MNEQNIPTTETTVTKTSKMKAVQERTFKFAKEKPIQTGAILLAVLAFGYFLYNSTPSKPGVPVISTNLAATSYDSTPRAYGTQSRQQNFGVVGEWNFQVQSARKMKTQDGDKIFLNNVADYKVATQTVVIDLKICPQFATIDPRTLIGRNIFAKGNLGAYAGKSQLTVTDPTNLRILDSLPAPKMN